MVATTSIALLLSLSVGSYAMAIPELAVPRAEAVHKRSSYSIPAVRNVNYVRNGAAAMKKAYNKYNLKPTGGLAGSFLESLPENIVKRQDGSAVATPATGDVEYLVPVSIGGETLNLDFDTGSSDL
jgi:aspergillopepsin I